MELLRQKGKDSLNTVISLEQNIKIIEKYIFKIVNEHFTYKHTDVCDEDSDCEEDEVYQSNLLFINEYDRIIYQIIGDIIEGIKLKVILKNIKDKFVSWEHTTFHTIKNLLNEHDEFIVNPFEVSEGVLECKCGSKRTFSFGKQVRGSDEATSTFVECMSCGCKWREN